MPKKKTSFDPVDSHEWPNAIPSQDVGLERKMWRTELQLIEKTLRGGRKELLLKSIVLGQVL
jgi:hypothetical protein